jgi:hypothetical protein
VPNSTTSTVYKLVSRNAPPLPAAHRERQQSSEVGTAAAAAEVTTPYAQALHPTTCSLHPKPLFNLSPKGFVLNFPTPTDVAHIYSTWLNREAFQGKSCFHGQIVDFSWKIKLLSAVSSFPRKMFACGAEGAAGRIAEPRGGLFRKPRLNR